ncbi:hypothetical protein [Candidatus Tisiphia endosymbiont of Micropterix aruncella]|uniref:hypothetical protein n=1 Tax=Candidatus Tisiphia endosymbiont of Micropterix aruncella TaxID=3066271 RepID=UPI003AA97EFE
MEQRLYTSPTSRVVKTILEVGNYLIMSAKGSIIAAFTFCTKLIFIIYISSVQDKEIKERIKNSR